MDLIEFTPLLGRGVGGEASDQMGRKIFLPALPKRIVSLVPSQTELLYDLGLENELVGITKFCIHPETVFRTKARVGGTKKIDFAKIRALNPDLIIGNKEENEKEQIEALMHDFPVWMSDIKNLEDACEMIHKIGEITGTQSKALEITSKIKTDFHELKNSIFPLNKVKVAYFIWKDPYMTIGGDTFINHILEALNFENVFKTKPGRYPEITLEEIILAKPKFIFLSSEPYPFKEKHIEGLQKIAPGSTIRLVDGEMFSWYGSRLLHAPKYFRKLLNTIC